MKQRLDTGKSSVRIGPPPPLALGSFSLSCRPTHKSFAIPLRYHTMILVRRSSYAGACLVNSWRNCQSAGEFFFCVRSTMLWRLYISNLLLDCPFWSAHHGQDSFDGVLRRARRTRHCRSAGRCPLLVSLSMVMRRFSCF